MCLGIPMQIKELNPPLAAWVETRGVRRLVSTVLVLHEDLRVGDWVIIHVGSAIGKINEAEALETLALLEKMSEASGAAAVLSAAPPKVSAPKEAP